ncbi:ATP-binding protein [Rhodovulum adriaticum]|uniref:IstB-like ATP binding protein n=1 Tax=Rhodovulum adriaticum TaxID=35804 RepID=A0A4V2SL01_RHOAD|nr:ATP-binding protein [Rhodovulum adriaticum]TCP21546.1 IstB-like ATP binding protein [Rhodovulum adriaticum]
MRRLPMRKIADALRLKTAGLATRKIAASLNVGQSTVSEYLKRAERAGLSWPLPDGMACALGQKACRDGKTVLYHRLPRLFADLELAQGDGSFPRMFRQLVRTDLLILDDWGPDRLTAMQRRHLMEIVEDRYQTASIAITSQLPVAAWHEVIGEPTFADAILDRIVHNAHRLTLDGPSMRKADT